MIHSTDYNDDHDDIASLLGAYAIHATDSKEAKRVEEHLRECPRCRTEVDGFHEIAAAMGNSVEPVSAALWDRIAYGMGERSQGAPDLSDVGDPPFSWLRGTIEATSAGAGATGIDARIADVSSGRSRRPRSSRRAGAIVAGVAAVTIGLLSVNLAQSDHHANQLQSALSAKGDSAAVAAALANPNHTIVRMRSADGIQVAQFVVVPGGKGYMTTSSMPSLPKDETYQLWAVIDGQPISVGILGNQVSTAAFTVGGSVSPSKLWITVEPSGGVVAPDRSPVATGTVV